MNCSIALTKFRVIGSTALVEATLAFLCCRMNRSAPSTICSRGTMAFRYIRSMHSTSKTTCLSNTSATVCGSFDFGSACGVPLRPRDRLTVVPFMEVVYHLPSHARKRSQSTCLSGWGEAPLVYPGNAVGVQGTVPSMRLKWIRKGAEDYEYVELLKKRGRGAWALSIVRQVATDFQNWSGDPAAIERARRMMGEALSRH